MRAKVTITDKDVPLKRDPSWEAIDDPASFELSNPNLLRIEKSGISADGFTFRTMAFEETDQ
jgi:hypothetical protein